VQKKVEFSSAAAALEHNKRVDAEVDKAVDNLLRCLPWWHKG